MKKWYVIYTYPGYEEKVCSNLEKRVQNAKMGDMILQVKIPKEDVIEIKNGQKKTVEKKYYPGYVFIEIKHGDDGQLPLDAWSLVKETPGIANFVGANGSPQVISDEEVQNILQRANETKLRVVKEARFNVDDQVRITDGPFTNFNGVVEEIYMDKEKLKVSVEIFGRPTPIEVDFLQVELL